MPAGWRRPTRRIRSPAVAAAGGGVIGKNRIRHDKSSCALHADRTAAGPVAAFYAGVAVKEHIVRDKTLSGCDIENAAFSTGVAGICAAGKVVIDRDPRAVALNTAGNDLITF